MNKTLVNWKDIYTLPLVDIEGWVYDSKNNFVFEFCIDGVQGSDKIISCINGNYTMINPTQKYRYEQDYIIEVSTSTRVLHIRGWGNLTSPSKHNLSTEDACNVQDTFAEFIVNQLNRR